jgi:hypothetical protein
MRIGTMTHGIFITLMSLGIAFKGAEGIVLAADSRVTLTSLVDLPNSKNKAVIPATFDNATKLLSIKSQPHVGAVTFGAGAIGATAPRTAASFVPEFEDELAKLKKGRLSVEEFANQLGKFFTAQWTAAAMPNPPASGDEMFFLVGGYDEGAPHGRVFHVIVPTAPKAVEDFPGLFGATWGGQRQFVDRLMGFDPEISKHIYEILKVPAAQQDPTQLNEELKKKLALPIPWQFLPLQDCIDLCVFLIRTTIQLQRLLVVLRGVGGAIDIATITRTDGFRTVQVKELKGDDVFSGLGSYS